MTDWFAVAKDITQRSADMIRARRATCAVCGKFLSPSADTTVGVFTPDSECGPEGMEFYHRGCRRSP
jgi:hypothetical protein